MLTMAKNNKFYSKNKYESIQRHRICGLKAHFTSSWAGAYSLTETILTPNRQRGYGLKCIN